MQVTDFNGLLVINTHFSYFGAVERKISFSFVMIEKFGKFIFDVFDCLFLLDPLS